MKKNISALFLVSAISLPASFGQIITGVNARASSEFGGRPAVNAVNGSGLTGNDHSNDFNHMWLSDNGDTTGTFEVDLGAVYNLNTVEVWNYNEMPGAADFTQRGVQTGNLEIATSFGAYTPAGPVAFNQAPGTAGNFSQSFPFGGAAVRFMRLNITSNYGDAGFTGLSELRFDGALAPQALPLPVAGVTASSNINDNTGFDRLADYTVDGSGMFGPTHSIAPEPNMWLGISGDTAPDITWDLGAVIPLSHMDVWNYNENANATCCLGRGINDTDIYVSDNGVDFNLLDNHDFAIAPGVDNVDFSETVALNTSARYVRFDILSNHGDASFTGLSEVQFFAIPEPSAALLFGLSCLALLARRRRGL